MKGTRSPRKTGITLVSTSWALRLVAEMWSFQPWGGSCTPAGARYVQTPECFQSH
ncbi:MAG TPA: hypothetical protein VGA71_03095 [Actinomycetota bacterium]